MRAMSAYQSRVFVKTNVWIGAIIGQFLWKCCNLLLSVLSDFNPIGQLISTILNTFLWEVTTTIVRDFRYFPHSEIF